MSSIKCCLLTCASRSYKLFAVIFLLALGFVVSSSNSSYALEPCPTGYWQPIPGVCVPPPPHFEYPLDCLTESIVTGPQLDPTGSPDPDAPPQTSILLSCARIPAPIPTRTPVPVEPDGYVGGASLYCDFGEGAAAMWEAYGRGRGHLHWVSIYLDDNGRYRQVTHPVYFTCEGDPRYQYFCGYADYLVRNDDYAIQYVRLYNDSSNSLWFDAAYCEE